MNRIPMLIYLNFKNIILSLILFTLSGCSNLGDLMNKSMSNQGNSSCSEKPQETLTKNNVKKIVLLNDQKITESGQVSVGKNIGYAFDGQSGQKLNYQTDDNICIWVFTPDNNILNDIELPQSGTYIIQVAALRGSKTFNLDLGFGDFSVSSESDSSASKTTQPKSIVFDSKSSQLTEKQAVDIVANWYRSKSEIFGQSFDSELVKKYTTGKLEEDTLKSDGSMNWLRNNGCSYTYYISNIEDVISFSNSGQRPTLIVQIYEKLKLNGPKAAGCGNPTQSYRANVTYWFEQDNEIWKIYQYEVKK